LSPYQQNGLDLCP